jgi:hypothetical protein
MQDFYYLYQQYIQPKGKGNTISANDLPDDVRTDLGSSSGRFFGYLVKQGLTRPEQVPDRFDNHMIMVQSSREIDGKTWIGSYELL